MIALIDYLTFSVKDIPYKEAYIKSIFGDIEWEVGRGMYGYLDCQYYEGIRIFSKKIDDKFEVCVSMSGTGCRAFESIKGEDFEWCVFFDNLLEEYMTPVHFSRIDIALDVRDEWLPSMKKICGHVADNKYISRFRRNIYTLGSEEFVFFGSPQSDTRLRIYNKALERGFDDQHWIRFEYQLRNESAVKFIKEYMQNKNVGFTIQSCLNNSVRFTTKPNKRDGNQDRLKTVKWWQLLTDGADKISLFERVGREYNIENLKDYLNVQVAPSLYTYLECSGGDVGGLMDLIKNAENRLNDRQRALIKQFEKEF